MADSALTVQEILSLKLYITPHHRHLLSPFLQLCKLYTAPLTFISILTLRISFLLPLLPQAVPSRLVVRPSVPSHISLPQIQSPFRPPTPTFLTHPRTPLLHTSLIPTSFSPPPSLPTPFSPPASLPTPFSPPPSLPSRLLLPSRGANEEPCVTCKS